MELLENLQQTRKLVLENIDAQDKAKALKSKLLKSDIDSLIIIPAFFISFAVIYFNKEMLIQSIFLTNKIEINAIIVLFIFLLINILAFIYGRKFKKNIIKNRLSNNKNQFEKYDSIINSTYDDCVNNSQLPDTYWDINSIDKIIEYIKNKRADNLKEAINLLEDERIKLSHLGALDNINKTQQQIQKQILAQTIISTTKSRNLFD